MTRATLKQVLSDLVGRVTSRQYNETIMDYFKSRSEDLLVLNIGKSGEYERFIIFLLSRPKMTFLGKIKPMGLSE